MSTIELNLSRAARSTGPVECLGQSFANEAARREHFTARLRAALEELAALDVPFTSAEDAAGRLRALARWPVPDDARLVELAQRMRAGRPEASLLERWKDEVGFPHGAIEDILRLSDPPFYTACPNPFLSEFIQAYGRPYDPAEPYHREPFAADVSEGKNDPIYNAHSYHTKVPHRAVMRYILHYTEPGDLVFDGFCGTGMTGVAAQFCGDRTAVESLGYRVRDDGTILAAEMDDNGRTVWKPFSKLGTRRAVLNDLSPAATFIAHNYNTPVDVDEFEREAKRILAEVQEECGWMYATLHNPTPEQVDQAVAALEGGADPEEVTGDSSLPWGRINYTVWSDIFICPECSVEVVFWDEAVDRDKKVVRDPIPCPGCGASVTKRNASRATSTFFDRAANEMATHAKLRAAMVSYSVGKARFEKRPDAADAALLRITEDRARLDVPVDALPNGYNTRQPRESHGYQRVHHFYTARNLACLAAFVERARMVAEHSVASRILFAKTASERITSRLASIAFSYYFHGGGGFVNAGRKGTLYVTSVVPEVPAYLSLESRLSSVAFKLPCHGGTCLATGSTTTSRVPPNSLDYIFFDPPFGGNIMYSEMNFIWESWLRCKTNNRMEAIENAAQAKGVDQYRSLMTASFVEAFRALKPGRWMTVEFSNTQASVWNSIQTALQDAGFVIANVASLDKQQRSIMAYSSPTAVKQDLIISAYKPAAELEARFVQEGGHETSVWSFVRAHLENLPPFKTGRTGAEFITERDPRILYDRVVAWFVRHGAPVPLSAQEFQAGLAQRFDERDGMYFLPVQTAEYERRVRQVGAPQQELFVSDERSAIDWLRNFLKKRPSVYSDIQPEFLKQLGAGWNKHDTRPELRDLLDANFLQYDGLGEVPTQIHRYLSRSYADLRNLPKDDLKLVGKARDRWYIPDPKKAIDLEKLRDRQLLKEFQEYRGPGARKLRVFRLEAVRAGFRKAWQERDYATIVEVANRVPYAVLQEDPLLLRWYDNAVTRLGGG